MGTSNAGIDPLVVSLQFEMVNCEAAFQLVDRIRIDVVVAAAHEEIHLSSDDTGDDTFLERRVRLVVVFDSFDRSLSSHLWPIITNLFESQTFEGLVLTINSLHLEDPLVIGDGGLVACDVETEGTFVD